MMQLRMATARIAPLLLLLLLGIINVRCNSSSSRGPRSNPKHCNSCPPYPPKLPEIQNCVPINLTTTPSSPRKLLQTERQPDQTKRQCNGCNFGDLPGMWDPQAPPGAKWQTLTRECGLTNMVEKYRLQNCTQRTNPAPPKVLMLLGDSVDREMIGAIAQTYNLTEHICEGAPGWNKNRVHAIRVSPSCGGPIIGRIHIFGSSPVGPWDQGVQESYETILQDKVPGMWRGKLGLPDPDMVVINCNLWDIGRLSWMSQHHLSTEFQQLVLPRAFVDTWLDNSRQLVRFVQAMFPKAVIGWHSVVIGRHSARDGVMDSPQLGKKSFVEQLNAAGRALASELGLLMLDYEAMQARFHDFSYLIDNHHQSAEVSMEAANLYFNLLDQLPALPYDYYTCQVP